jgi:hypothetical protein
MLTDDLNDDNCGHSWPHLEECVDHPGGGMTVVWYCPECKHRWKTHDEP